MKSAAAYSNCETRPSIAEESLKRISGNAPRISPSIGDKTAEKRVGDAGSDESTSKEDRCGEAAAWLHNEIGSFSIPI